MRKVIVVLNNAQPRIVKTPHCKKYIIVFAASAERSAFVRLPVELKFVTFENGKCGVISIASERAISLSEALRLHNQLSGK